MGEAYIPNLVEERERGERLLWEEMQVSLEKTNGLSEEQAGEKFVAVFVSAGLGSVSSSSGLGGGLL